MFIFKGKYQVSVLMERAISNVGRDIEKLQKTVLESPSGTLVGPSQKYISHSIDLRYFCEKYHDYFGE